MTKTCIALREIEDAVHLACRAPSYHNSQPWSWVLDSGTVKLFLDPGQLVPSDRSGRQALLSCGAALDHFRVAMAERGWTTSIDRFPDPSDRHHLADIDLHPATAVTPAQHDLAHAILTRHTDRLPFEPVDDWPDFERVLRLVTGNRAQLDVITPDQRHTLADTAHLAEALRMYDTAYHAELSWWTKPFIPFVGIPQSALVSAQESDRVDIGRSFPVTHNRERRLEVGDDHATVAVISALGDTAADILACGEALSAVLLQATVAGLATCTLTQMTEQAATRDMVSTLTGHPFPQVLVRIGVAPVLDGVSPTTPRRPLSDVFHCEPPHPEQG